MYQDWKYGYSSLSPGIRCSRPNKSKSASPIYKLWFKSSGPNGCSLTRWACKITIIVAELQISHTWFNTEISEGKVAPQLVASGLYKVSGIVWRDCWKSLKLRLLTASYSLSLDHIMSDKVLKWPLVRFMVETVCFNIWATKHFVLISGPVSKWDTSWIGPAPADRQVARRISWLSGKLAEWCGAVNSKHAGWHSQVIL